MFSARQRTDRLLREGEYVRMFNRLGGWWAIWAVLAVTWTLAVFASGWMNLPRAQHMPHDPLFLSKLSVEASTILRGPDVKAKPTRGALVWSEGPKTVRMWNDTPLIFPATTTNERVAFVAGEYGQLLNVEAERQRWPYLLKMLAIWLAPIVLLLVGGMVTGLICRGYQRSTSRTNPRGPSSSAGERAVAPAFAIRGTGNRIDGDIPESWRRPSNFNFDLMPVSYARRNIPRYVRQRTETVAGAGDNPINDGAPAKPIALCRAAGFIPGIDSQQT